MSDTIEVKRPCEHGFYDGHSWIELKSDGWQKWCDGGKRIVLVDAETVEDKASLNVIGWWLEVRR